jgi:2'-hydroxyisoflavone reductase
MIGCAEQSTVGVFNSISRSGHTDMSELLEACRITTDSDAKFTWVSSEFILKQGIRPWSGMPIWLDPASHGIHSFNTSRAARSGLTCRPITETVADTWAWLQEVGQTQIPAGIPAPGISAEKEQATLAAWAKQIG